MHALKDFVERFRGAFTAPTFTNFTFIALSWIWRGPGGTLTGLLRAPAPLPHDIDQRVRAKHFSTLHRFFSRANWCSDTLGHLLFRMLATHLGSVVLLAVDDTLCRRTGLNVIGAGAFVDPLRKDRKTGRKIFSFGTNFVVLSVWIDVSWMSGGGMMVPVLWRLYRSKKTCPEHLYKKQSELAVEMLHVVAGWLDPESKVRVVADHAYISGPVGNHLPANFHLIGPLKADYVLYSPIIPPYKGRGRRATRGPRLEPIPQLCQSYCASARRVFIYSQWVDLLVGTLQVVWEPLGNRRLSLVLTRDPSGRYEPRAFISTCSDDGIEFILRLYARRWRLEIVFREAKQLLGMEDVCNGFCHVAGRVARPRGAQAPESKVPVASERTAPFALLCYSLVVAWFIEQGDPREALAHATKAAPWYRHKKTLSFGDMLDSMRRAMWREFRETGSPSKSPETHHPAAESRVSKYGQSAGESASARGSHAQDEMTSDHAAKHRAIA